MNKPLASHKILALLQGTELLGKERGNLEALSALQNQGSHHHGGGFWACPGGGSVGEEARRRGFETHEFPMGSHFAKEWMLKDRGYRKSSTEATGHKQPTIERPDSHMEASHIHIAAHTTLFSSHSHCSSIAPPWSFDVATPPQRLSIPNVLLEVDGPPQQPHRGHQPFHQAPNFRDDSKRHSRGHWSFTTLPQRETDNHHRAEIERLKKTKETFQLVYVGQIHPMKGVPELIQALVTSMTTALDAGL